MKNIKFRGKEIKTNHWIYGKLLENINKGDGMLADFHYIAPFDITPTVTPKYTMWKGGYPKYKNEEDISHCWKEREYLKVSIERVKADTIGQYIGLHDRNGVEIYEGDILEHFFCGCGETDRYIVEWDTENLQYAFRNIKNENEYIALEDLYNDDIGDYAINVIGNIYEQKGVKIK